MATFVRFLASLSIDTFLLCTLAPFAVAFVYAYFIPRTSVRMLAFVILRIDIALTLLRIVGGAGTGSGVTDGSAEVVFILVLVNIGFVLQAYKAVQLDERRRFPEANNLRPTMRGRSRDAARPADPPAERREDPPPEDRPS